MKTLGLNLLKISWIAGFVLMCVTGCGGKDSGEQLPPLVVDDQDILAKYNGGQITMKQAAEWYSLFGDRSKALVLESNETPWVQETVRNMIVEDAFSKEARELKLDESEAMLEKKKDLTNRAISKLYYRRHLVDLIEIPDREIQSYFNDHRKEYGTPEKFYFYMIFFDVEKQGREKARRRAELLLERIHAGAPFESLIVENSDIPEQQRAQEFGPYEVGGGLIPAVEEAAVKLKVGEISGLIEHKKGFHVIKISSKTEAYEPKLEDVRDAIHDALFYEKLRKAEERLLSKEKKNLEIQENYHIIGLPITSLNDVVLKIEDQTMTYGQYIQMIRENNLQTEEQLQAELNRRYSNMVYQVLGRRLGYDQDPEVLKWVDLNMQRDLTFAYLNDIINPLAIVPEEEIRKVYESTPNLFKYPKMVYAKQIYIPIQTRGDMAKHELIQEIKRSEAQAYQVIYEIRQGLAFEEAARLYSSAPNAANGGLLGWVPFGSSPRFDNAAFGLSPGEISSKPVEGKLGYQVLKVEKKVKSKVKSYEVAREQIYSRLFTEAADRLRFEKIEAITQEAKIELEPAASQFGRYFQEFWIRPNIYSVSD